MSRKNQSSGASNFSTTGYLYQLELCLEKKVEVELNLRESVDPSSVDNL